MEIKQGQVTPITCPQGQVPSDMRENFSRTTADKIPNELLHSGRLRARVAQMHLPGQYPAIDLLSCTKAQYESRCIPSLSCVFQYSMRDIFSQWSIFAAKGNIRQRNTHWILLQCQQDCDSVVVRCCGCNDSRVQTPGRHAARRA